MQAAHPHIRDVGASDFDREVIERSHEVPVLVDFWAPWCGPCRMLAPVLEELASEFKGKFILAKLDTDAHPSIAQRYSIRGIPAVKLFVAGEVAGEFTGALPGATIRKFLQQHIPSDADRLAKEAEDLLRSGEVDEARARLQTVVALDSGHPKARLGLARIALAAGDLEALETELSFIDPRAEEAEQAETLRKAVSLHEQCRAAGGEDACRARLAADPSDLEARNALGCCLAAQSRWDEALETLLESVKTKPNFGDGAARKAMVLILDLVGRRTELADHYVRQLQIYT